MVFEIDNLLKTPRELEENGNPSMSAYWVLTLLCVEDQKCCQENYFLDLKVIHWKQMELIKNVYTF